jgi:outer membrane scaffolding protein for murein synthesis (MipA/OmpV family)
MMARMEYERLLTSGSSYMVNWFGGSEYWSRKKTDYYFGVTADEVTSGRSFYQAEESYNLFSGLNAVKQFTSELSLIASAEYLWMSDEITHSPLTTRDDQWTVYAGIFCV